MESLYESLKTTLEENDDENVKMKINKKKGSSVVISVIVSNIINMTFTVEKEREHVFVDFWALHTGKQINAMSYIDILIRKEIVVRYYEMIEACIREDLQKDHDLRLLYTFQGDKIIQKNSTLHLISKK